MGLTPARLASSGAMGDGGTTSESGESGEQGPRQRRLRHRQVSQQQEDDWRCERQRLKGHRWQVDCSDKFQHNPSMFELGLFPGQVGGERVCTYNHSFVKL